MDAKTCSDHVFPIRRTFHRIGLLPTFALLLLASCTQTDTVEISKEEEAALRGARPISQEKAELLRALSQERPLPGTHAVIENRVTLFQTLDLNLIAWHNAAAKKTVEDQRMAANLVNILTRTVHWNFDAISAEIKKVGSLNRVIAAGALGFSPTRPTDTQPDRSPEAVPILLEAATEGDDLLTRNVLTSLGLIADPDTPHNLIADFLLRHHDPEVRSAAAFCISRLAIVRTSDDWLNFLIPALGDTEAKVRLQTVSALAHLKDPESGYSLVNTLGDRSALVRANAARALGELQNPMFGVYLLDLLESPIPVVKQQAHKALIKMSGDDYGDTKADWVSWCEDARDKPS